MQRSPNIFIALVRVLVVCNVRMSAECITTSLPPPATRIAVTGAVCGQMADALGVISNVDVDLLSTTDNRLIAKAHVDGSGHLKFSRLPAGLYRPHIGGFSSTAEMIEIRNGPQRTCSEPLMVRFQVESECPNLSHISMVPRASRK